MSQYTLPIGLLLLATLLCLPTEAAELFLETWGVADDLAGWQSYGFTLEENGGSVEWGLTPAETYGLIIADETASGGRFAGDLAATGASFLYFELRPASGTTFTTFNVYLDTPEDTWVYSLPAAPESRWSSYLLPLDTESGQWTHQYGWETFEQSLSSVSQVIIEINTLDGGGGQLDNFGLGQTPEPATVCLLLGGGAVIALRRRRRTAA